MKIFTALLFTFFAGHALAASDVPPAKTGTRLDVVRIISITDTSNACGVVPVEMTYEDSQGEFHTVSYQVMGSGCSGG